MSVVVNVVRRIEKLSIQYNVKKVGYVTLEIGEISGALPHYVYSLWPHGTKGTICEDSQLQINTVPAIVKCSDCEKQYHLTEHLENELPVCPNCSGSHFSFIQGNDVTITEFGAID